MAELEMNKIDRITPRPNVRKFGNSTDVWPSSFAGMFPFECSTLYRSKDSEETVKFTISFDVIDVDLPFLIGLPTLKVMRANLNFEYLSLKYVVKLKEDGNHYLLQCVPFKRSYHGKAKSKWKKQNTYYNLPGVESNKYCIPDGSLADVENGVKHDVPNLYVPESSTSTESAELVANRASQDIEQYHHVAKQVGQFRSQA